MAASGVILDGVLGINQAEVNASNAVKVYGAFGSSAGTFLATVSVVIPFATGTVGNAQRVAIGDPVTGAYAEIDTNNSLMAAAVDGVGLYVENSPQTGVTATSGAALIMTTLTGTNTINGSDLTNTVHRGAVFWVNVVGSVNATCSVKIQIQVKNELLGTYVTITSLSLASIDTTTDGSVANQSIWVMPGVTATGGITNVYPNQLPRTFRVQASIVAQATATTRIVRLEVGMNKTL